MSLSKCKCWYLNNCFNFLKLTAPLWLLYKNSLLKLSVKPTSKPTWPPVWLVWNKLYDNCQVFFLFAKQANPNRPNRRSVVKWYFPHLVFPAFSRLASTTRRDLSATVATSDFTATPNRERRTIANPVPVRCRKTSEQKIYFLKLNF